MKLAPLERNPDAWDSNHNFPSAESVTSGDSTITVKANTRSVTFLTWKNVLLISVAVFTKNCGYNAVSNVQSSINSENGLGVVTLAIVTAGGIVGGFVAGPLLTRLEPKWVYVGGSVPMALYVGANFYPAWSVFIPAGVIYGLGSGVAAVANKVLLASLARIYYRKFNLDADRVTTRVFMMEIVASKLSMVVGNLASSLFLEQQDDGATISAPPATWQCGAAYCNEDMEESSLQPTRDQINALTAFSVSAVLLGCLVMIVFLDPIRRIIQASSIGPSAKGLISAEDGGLVSEGFDASHGGTVTAGSLMATCRMLSDRRLLLLLPSFLIFTAGDTFWMADFTKAFISCSIGVENVGLVSMWMGVSGAVASITFGLFNTEGARTFSLTLATILQMGVMMTLLFWTPSAGDDDNLFTLCVLTAAWYLGSGIRASLLPALLAILFPCELESAYTHLHVWSAVASMLMFALSDVVCVYIKIYLLLALLMLGMTGYLGVELALSCETAARRAEYIPIKDLQDCK